MADRDDRAQFTGFTLYDEQQAVLAQVAKDNGLSRSAALRMIISEWVRLRAEKDGIKFPFVPERETAA